MKFAVFILIIVTTVDAKLSKEEKLCVDYAFENKSLSAAHEIKLCKKFFDDQKADFRASFEPLFVCNPDDINLSTFPQVCNLECFTKNFEEYRISDLYMKGLINHLHSEADEEKSIEYEFKVNQTRSSAFEHVANQCVDSAMMASFVQLFLKDIKTMTNVEKFCLRRYAVEKNLIDPVEHDFAVSNLTSINCETSFKKYDENMAYASADKKIIRDYFGVHDRAISDCRHGQEASNKKILERHLMKLRAISSFDLSSQQVISLENEIRKMAKSYSLVTLECIRDYCSINCQEY